MLVAACAFALSCVALPTLADVPCGIPNDKVDLSALGSADITGSDGTPQYKYFLNVCGPLKSTDAASCTSLSKSASACQIEVVGTQTFDIGNWDATATAPTWKDSTKKTITFSMTGSPQCWAMGGAQTYQAQIVLNCADKQGPLTVADTTPASCTKIYTMDTPLACPGSGGGGGGDDGKGGKKGLSGGWIFIIILAVIAPLYVIGGCIYKGQKLGATGMDKCPNVEFWRDLPSLVKEGFVFTYSKIRGLCGGRAAAASNSYETM